MNSPSATSADDHSPIAPRDWRPDELGLARALLLASVAVTLLVAGLAALAGHSAAIPQPLPVTVRLVELTAALAPSAQAEAAPDAAATAPPPPVEEAAPFVPEPIAPPAMAAADVAPAPVPDALPDLAPEVTPAFAPPIAAPSQTVLPPPKPTARPALRRPARPQPSPAPTRAAATDEAPRLPAGERAASPATAPPAPADTTSGLGPYRAALHRQIERNMLNDREAQRLGVSGTAVIEASIAPDGRVLLARVARGSGNRAIDQAALAAVQRGGFAAFGAHMPSGAITISVPIGVEAE